MRACVRPCVHAGLTRAPPRYFKEPQQLLDIFTALEEANLFLIQNSQDTEQALEELKQNFRETKRKMDSKTRALEDTIADLRAQIAAEEGKASALKERAQAGCVPAPPRVCRCCACRRTAAAAALAAAVLAAAAAVAHHSPAPLLLGAAAGRARTCRTACCRSCARR